MSQIPAGPVALVLTFDQRLSDADIRRVAASLRELLAGSSLAGTPVIILDSGVRLHAIQADGAITGTVPLPDDQREAVHAALLAGPVADTGTDG